jgi:hypothetical protein
MKTMFERRDFGKPNFKQFDEDKWWRKARDIVRDVIQKAKELRPEVNSRDLDVFYFEIFHPQLCDLIKKVLSTKANNFSFNLTAFRDNRWAESSVEANDVILEIKDLYDALTKAGFSLTPDGRFEAPLPGLAAAASAPTPAP